MTDYTPIPLLPVAMQYAPRLTMPLGEGRVLVELLDWHDCDTCGFGAQFIAWRATDCDVWGMTGLDGAYSDVFGIYCAGCAYVNCANVRAARQAGMADLAALAVLDRH